MLANFEFKLRIVAGKGTLILYEVASFLIREDRSDVGAV